MGELVGEATLHTGVAEIGRTFLRGCDTDGLTVLHVYVEGAADAAIGAGGLHDLIGQTVLARAGLFQGRDGALEGTLTAADAVGLLETGVVAGDDTGVVAATRHLQDKGSLYLIAGPHTAGTADALVHLELDEGVRVVTCRIVGAWILVAWRAQADGLSQALQFASAIGRAVETLQRMVGDD